MAIYLPACAFFVICELSGMIASTGLAVLFVPSFFVVLQRLEERGWIVAEWGTSTKNRKARFYALTTAGRKQLAKETTRWRRLTAAIGRILGPDAWEA